MKILTKSHEYELYSKNINSLEKDEVCKRIGIIPKSLNIILSVYIDNLLYYFQKTDELICIKEQSNNEEIICLKVIYTKNTNSLKIIGVTIPHENNKINLELIDIGNLNSDIDNNEIDSLLVNYPFLLSIN